MKGREIARTGQKVFKTRISKSTQVSGCPLQDLQVFKSCSFIRIILTFLVHIKTKNLQIKSQFFAACHLYEFSGNAPINGMTACSPAAVSTLLSGTDTERRAGR